MANIQFVNSVGNGGGIVCRAVGIENAQASVLRLQA